MNVSLILQKKDGDKRAFPVRGKAVILGRRPDCDLCIPLQVVSRRHCQLSIEEEILKIRDLKSSNGTFLNGKRIFSETVAKPGDNLRLGPLSFRIRTDNIPAEQPPEPDQTAEDTSQGAYQASSNPTDQNSST